ncbi:hypothetical protein BAUCODRAFT_124066 [Baudoinia panamericana UAMH 10762]|uniref:UBZ4-type domain-containing protein n=1 Tax=Baudoinia panamericana (strain UAMH 10762) TaxID=717646 RepID=M2N6N6_BAUPA|nr:uncharacterized protein BAUCODRAFT_124066 [Baudoinia panamericana UAMH 10762]EMC94440.1 hypothetical protein BAUCODRAFT_124066 [Baudoinia panamericana UAMH 10762]
MNRPRNRQPRPPRDNNVRASAGQGSQSAFGNVPSVAQVVRGAAVSIVLKADQPTGREVQGVVQDLLTRGNHPRGIKVRLQDGRIGRVQRMANAAQVVNSHGLTPMGERLNHALEHLEPDPYRSVHGDVSGRPPRILRMEKDARVLDAEFPSEPPARSLAAYFPDSDDGGATVSQSVTATCPICGNFEGDEVAVSRHVDTHVT